MHCTIFVIMQTDISEDLPAFNLLSKHSIDSLLADYQTEFYISAVVYLLFATTFQEHNINLGYNLVFALITGPKS